MWKMRRVGDPPKRKFPIPMLATMYFPSGVHSGCSARFAAPRETWIVSKPSVAMTQMFWPPERSEVNATWVPSGEKRGWASKAMPEVSCVAWPPVMGMVKRSPR
jgi:hypothetical protein